MKSMASTKLVDLEKRHSDGNAKGPVNLAGSFTS